MLRSTRQSLFRRTDRHEQAFQTNARSLPQAPIFRKVKTVVFLLVAFVLLTQFFPALVPNARSAGPTYIYDSAGRLVGGQGWLGRYRLLV